MALKLVLPEAKRNEFAIVIVESIGFTFAYCALSANTIKSALFDLINTAENNEPITAGLPDIEPETSKTTNVSPSNLGTLFTAISTALFKAINTVLTILPSFNFAISSKAVIKRKGKTNDFLIIASFVSVS